MEKSYRRSERLSTRDEDNIHANKTSSLENDSSVRIDNVSEELFDGTMDFYASNCSHQRDISLADKTPPSDCLTLETRDAKRSRYTRSPIAPATHQVNLSSTGVQSIHDGVDETQCDVDTPKSSRTSGRLSIRSLERELANTAEMDDDVDGEMVLADSPTIASAAGWTRERRTHGEMTRVDIADISCINVPPQDDNGIVANGGGDTPCNVDSPGLIMADGGGLTRGIALTSTPYTEARSSRLIGGRRNTKFTTDTLSEIQAHLGIGVREINRSHLVKGRTTQPTSRTSSKSDSIVESNTASSSRRISDEKVCSKKSDLKHSSSSQSKIHKSRSSNKTQSDSSSETKSTKQSKNSIPHNNLDTSVQSKNKISPSKSLNYEKISSINLDSSPEDISLLEIDMNFEIQKPTPSNINGYSYIYIK